VRARVRVNVCKRVCSVAGVCVCKLCVISPVDTAG
jgi:hypothetical protein